MPTYYVLGRKQITEEQTTAIVKHAVQLLIDEPYISRLFGNQVDGQYYVYPVASWGVDHSSGFYDIAMSLANPEWLKTKRSIFFDLTDTEDVSSAIVHHIVFKASATRENKTLGMYYPIPPVWNSWFEMYGFPGIEKAQVDISFQGALTTHPVREDIPLVIQRCKRAGFSTHYKELPRYFYELPFEQRKVQRVEYYNSILDARFVLCPRGGGLSSHRLYEVLAAGRIPVIYSDQLVLPLEGAIDWGKFSIRVPEKHMIGTPKYIAEFLDKNNVQQASQLAMETWQTYFCPCGLRNFLDKSIIWNLL